MKKRFANFLLAAAVAVGILGFHHFIGLDGLELRSVDFRFHLRGDRAPHPDVVVVAADEKSIAEMGRWPWRRDVHGVLIDFLSKAGAKVVAFDVLFTEPDRDRPQSDARLGDRAEKSGRAVFGMLFQREQDGRPAKPLLPLPALRTSPAGFVNIFAEIDGVSRRLPVWVEYEGRPYYGLAFAAYAAALGRSPEDVLRSASVPTEEGPWNEINLNFVGGYETFPYHSYVDVYKGRADPADFKDKIVLVGGTAIALFDTQSVPNVANFPGLEIHANALDNYLNGNYLRRAGRGWTVFFVLLFTLAGALFLPRVAVWKGAVIFAALAAGYFLLTYWLFAQKNVLLEFVIPATAIVATYLVIFSYRLLTEEKEKRWIKGTFSQYMSKKLVDILASDPDRMKLGGEEKEMTVFFSDLAGFTTLSESMRAPDLVHLLNEYLTEMSDIILVKYDGFVDKYIGDAIMAFWNAPLDQPDHAKLACFAALDQMEKLKELQRRFAERKLPAIDCRMGINTGLMVVGNMGSNNKFNYTVIGDPVNQASRFEGANKAYHTHIMISETTYEKAKNDVEVRQLDLLRVKGKNLPIRVYELAARKDGLSEAQKNGFALYGEGLAFYLERKFEKALDKFKKTLAHLPDDGPSQVYIKRSEDYIKAPPPKNWDGVFVMTTK
ncbi:MAG: CHASE2 domain-containing protein [Elusimicrobiota bacterium]